MLHAVKTVIRDGKTYYVLKKTSDVGPTECSLFVTHPMFAADKLEFHPENKSPKIQRCACYTM